MFEMSSVSCYAGSQSFAPLPELQDRVYRNQIKDVEELCQRVDKEWDSLDQRVIDSAVREWRKRL